MAFISNLDLSPELQLHPGPLCVVSNRHVKLTMSQIEPLIFPQTCSDPQFSSLDGQRMANSILPRGKDSKLSSQS